MWLRVISELMGITMRKTPFFLNHQYIHMCVVTFDEKKYSQIILAWTTFYDASAQTRV